MSFEFERLARLRPYLYHLTARSNVALIVSAGRLQCTRALLEDAGLAEIRNRTRRLALESITTPMGQVTIRDQAPLHTGSIAFESGWDAPTFVAHVNEHVFTWPGDERGPIPPGRNHYKRYASERPLLLRFRTALVESLKPKLCRYNSGAPRCSDGKHSPRGSNTYIAAEAFDGNVSDVVEVVFEHALVLPRDVEIAERYEGPWQKLYEDAPRLGGAENREPTRNER